MANRTMAAAFGYQEWLMVHLGDPQSEYFSPKLVLTHQEIV